MKYWSCWLIFTLRSKFGSYCLIIWKYNTHASNSLGDIRQNHWTIKYRSHRLTFILRSNTWSYWPIIQKYYVHISNSLQDVTQNHWTMKYRSQWPIFILRSNFGSYWLIIPNNNVNTSNSRQDLRQNHWTMEYRSQWHTWILRSNFWSYWLIIPNNNVHTSNSLQDIRQNHWTVKYRSCWPSLHDLQVHVTRFNHVRPTICISCSHNRKSRKTLFKGVLVFLSLVPPRGMDPGVRSHGMKVDPPGYLWSKYECFLMSGWWDILHLICFNVKLGSNSTNGTKLLKDKHTNGKTKTIYPRHKCRGYNQNMYFWIFTFFIMAQYMVKPVCFSISPHTTCRYILYILYWLPGKLTIKRASWNYAKLAPWQVLSKIVCQPLLLLELLCVNYSTIPWFFRQWRVSTLRVIHGEPVFHNFLFVLITCTFQI